MAIFRIKKTKDFTTMSNNHLRNRSLSLKAKGLQSLMLSLPENWDFTLAGLACICQDGIGSVRSGILELEKHGYLTRRRIREANGQLGDIEYTIHEIPQEPDKDKSEPPSDDLPPICEKPTPQKPKCENPTLAFHTYENCTQLSNTSNQLSSKSNIDSVKIHQSTGADASDTMDAMDIYREILKENIGYDALCEQHNDNGVMDEIVELMVETVCSTKKIIRVNREDKPAEVVKNRMMKLDQSHIEYVLEALGENTTEVRNIRNYLLTALYNAPGTIGSHYKAMVNHDFGNK